MKRTVAGAAALGLVVAAAGGGWFAGQRVASPAEVAARTKAPPPSRITVPVERTVLSSTLITRGLVRYGEPKPIVLSSSTLKTVAPVVTQIPEKGRSLGDGDKAMEIGGRPVIVLQGALPTYRDLRPGDEGVDVDQLKAALSRRGFNAGPAGSRYDKTTENAVAAWYRSLGYDAFGPTDAQNQQLKTARDAAQRSQDAVLSARRTLDQALSPDRKLQVQENADAANDRVVTAQESAAQELRRAQTEVSAREAAVDAAQDGANSAAAALSKAEREVGDRTVVTDAAAAVTEGELAVSDAQQALVDAQRAKADAVATLPDAQKNVDLAKLDLLDAQKNIDDAKKNLETAKRGHTVNTIVLDSSGINQVTKITISDEEIRTAEANVRVAESRARSADNAIVQANAAVSQRQRAIDDAQSAIDRAQRALLRAQNSLPRLREAVTKANQSVSDRGTQIDELRAKSVSANDAVVRARSDLATAGASLETARMNAAVSARQAKSASRIAGAALAENRKAADVKTARAQLANAEDSLTRARADLAELESKIGIAVPANEVLFFPSLPLRVDDTKLNRGDPVTGPVMTVTTARLAVDTELDVADAKLVKVGSAVSIEASEFDITLPATITELATAPGTKGVSPDKVYVEVTPDPGPNADVAQLNGSSVKLTVPVSSTGTAVLAVPAVALSVAADGSTRVEVEDDPAKPTRFVTVTPGLAAEGKVAVKVVGNGSLKEGDSVVVGAAGSTTVSGTTDAGATAEQSTAPTT